MRSVSVELEILGRHQHPDLTIPFLKVNFFTIYIFMLHLHLPALYTVRTGGK